MHKLPILCCPLCIGCTVLALLSQPARAERYAVTVLAPLPGDNHSQAYALNVHGDAVGASFPSYNDTGVPHPVLWHNGVPVSLSPLEGKAMGINASGQIVGTVKQTIGTWTGNKAVSWTNGAMQVLEPGVAEGDTAVAINDLGHIVEQSDMLTLPNGAYQYFAYLVKDGVRTPLLPNGGGFEPHRINAADQIAGNYLPGTVYTFSWYGSPITLTEIYPAVWSNGASQVLVSNLGGGTYGWAYGINDAGDIVGATACMSCAAIPNAFFLGNLPSQPSANLLYKTALAVNNHGQVVGNSGPCVLWENGTRKALPDLLADPNLAPYGVRDINDAGQITGYVYGTGGGARLYSPVVPGDANGDGKVTLADAEQALQFAAGLRTATPEEAWRADAVPNPSTDPTGYGDRILDLRDAVTILRAAMG